MVISLYRVQDFLKIFPFISTDSDDRETVRIVQNESDSDRPRNDACVSIEGNRSEMFHALLERIADINHRYLKDVLMKSIVQNRPDMFHALLQRGVDIDKGTWATPIVHAIEYDRPEMIRELLRRGARMRTTVRFPDRARRFFATPLIQSIAHNDERRFHTQLRKQGVDVDRPNQ